MAITVACSCGKRFRAKDDFAGKRTKCPGCGAVLEIPSAKPSQAPSPEVKPKSSKRATGATSAPEQVETRKTSQVPVHQEPPPVRKLSIAGLIVSALLVIVGVMAVFNGPPPTDSVQRAVHASQVLMPVMGGVALAVRLFLPNPTFLRGLAVVFGGMGVGNFLVMLGMHGPSGRASAMLGLLLIPAIGFLFGFRTGEVRNRFERRLSKTEAIVKTLKEKGHSPTICEECFGAGALKGFWFLDKRCSDCRGRGYLAKA